jgi:hypothetical protein
VRNTEVTKEEILKIWAEEQTKLKEFEERKKILNIKKEDEK